MRLGKTEGDSLQLVVLLTSSCPYCKASLPAWSALARELSDSMRAVSIIALTTDSAHVATAYAVEHGLGFPLVPIPERRLAALFRAFTVPQTVLLGSDGRILYSRLGTLELGPSVDSIRAAIRDRTGRPRVD